MSLKTLFLTVFSLLFTPGKFWRELKETNPSINALKDYAVPLIAVAQLVKFPLIGVPRTAMMFSLISFIVDISALYLLAGAVVYLLDRDYPEALQQRVMTVLCYSLTPVWLFEPFCFTGRWSWYYAAFALTWALFIGKSGFSLMLHEENAHREGATPKAALLIILVNIASFMVLRGFIRFFNI
jgi:hypothetical protein